MLKKFGIAVVGSSLISLLMLGIQGRLGCATVWADSWVDDGDNAEQIEPAKTTPPSIAGSWSGSVVDKYFGTGDISMDLTQSGGKFKGTMVSSFGSGNISGSVSTSGAIKFTVKFGRVCHLSGSASLVSSTEMSASYKVLSCGKSDKGDDGTFLETLL